MCIWNIRGAGLTGGKKKDGFLHNSMCKRTPSADPEQRSVLVMSGQYSIIWENDLLTYLLTVDLIFFLSLLNSSHFERIHFFMLVIVIFLSYLMTFENYYRYRKVTFFISFWHNLFIKENYIYGLLHEPKMLILT